MGLNEGFLETFIFRIETNTFKVTLNYTKGMCTVYASNGRILVRLEKLPRTKMLRIKKGLEDYMNGKCNRLPNFNNMSGRNFKGFRTV